MKVQFQTVDVFTDRQFGGNPLAVIPDARRLSDAQMQAIANEFNLAETTFVLPPSDSANTARVRIFTPRAEMPFAGHPNVGTAFVLARHDSVCGVRINRRNMTFEEIAGLVRMTIDTDDDLATGAALAAPQQLQIARDVDAGMIAQACSLDLSDIETRRHPPCLASCGAPFVIAEVRRSRRASASATTHGCLPHSFATRRGDRNSSLCRGRGRGRRLSVKNVCAAAWRLRRPCDRQRECRADRTACSFATRIVVAAGSRHWSRHRFGTTEPDAGCCGKGCRRSHPDFDWRRLQAGDVRLDRSGIGLSG